MKTPVMPLAILCALPALLSCSATPPAGTLSYKVTPLLQITHADNSAAGLYQLGRYYQAQNRLTLAEESYRKALALSVDSVESRSALGTLYAGQGKYDEAISEFSAVLRTAPQIAQIYNNLGYTYYLQGNHQAAVDALGKATALEPNNARAFNNLGAAYEKLGRTQDARDAFARAADLHAGSKRAATPQATSQVGAQFSANVLPPAASGPAVDLTAPVVAAPLDAGSRVVPPDHSRPFRLEIANGNGTPGLARRFRDALGGLGQSGARLTNIKPYREKLSVIEYRPGYREEALRVRAHFAASLAVAEQSRQFQQFQHQGADVRLVLGHDVSSTAALRHPALAKASAE